LGLWRGGRLGRWRSLGLAVLVAGRPPGPGQGQQPM